MRPYILFLGLATAGLAGCADQPSPVDVPSYDVTASADSHATSNMKGLRYRVTGSFVSSQSGWSFIFDRMIVTNLDAWVDRAGNAGGSYDVQIDFVGGGEPLVSHEEVVCLSVDPQTHQAWIVSARPDEEWGTHYSILQMADRSPPAMSENGRRHSGHVDLFSGRTTPPWEEGSGPNFCLLQPDLAQLPVEIPGGDPFPATPMYPIDAGGDLEISVAGSGK